MVGKFRCRCDAQRWGIPQILCDVLLRTVHLRRFRLFFVVVHVFFHVLDTTVAFVTYLSTAVRTRPKLPISPITHPLLWELVQSFFRQASRCQIAEMVD